MLVATFLPKVKRFPTCWEVNSKTCFDVSLANFKLSFVYYFISFFYSFYTLLEMKLPKLSKPVDKNPPASFGPLFICLAAPIAKP